MTRLSADDLTHTRAFTTAVNAARRPSLKDTSETPIRSSVRSFNTSRVLKTPKDSSTVDFAFLPRADEIAPAPPSLNFNFTEGRGRPVVETPEPVSHFKLIFDFDHLFFVITIDTSVFVLRLSAAVLSSPT